MLSDPSLSFRSHVGVNAPRPLCKTKGRERSSAQRVRKKRPGSGRSSETGGLVCPLKVFTSPICSLSSLLMTGYLARKLPRDPDVQSWASHPSLMMGGPTTRSRTDSSECSRCLCSHHLVPSRIDAYSGRDSGRGNTSVHSGVQRYLAVRRRCQVQPFRHAQPHFFPGPFT